MSLASEGLLAREPRRFPNRRRPLPSAETLESMAVTARTLDARVLELRDALVELAQRGKPPKVQTYIDAQGWPNEKAIRARFLERYGYPPKTYALAFGACPDCKCVAICSTCETCVHRAKVQGISLLTASATVDHFLHRKIYGTGGAFERHSQKLAEQAPSSFDAAPVQEPTEGVTPREGGEHPSSPSDVTPDAAIEQRSRSPR